MLIPLLVPPKGVLGNSELSKAFVGFYAKDDGFIS